MNKDDSDALLYALMHPSKERNEFLEKCLDPEFQQKTVDFEGLDELI